MLLPACRSCPRQCGAARDEECAAPGSICAMPASPLVARAMLHHWEEPCISATSGSGAIFFSGCPLQCVYCQNYKLSHKKFGAPVTEAGLLEMFAQLEAEGAHNINLVNPTHFAPFLRRTLMRYSHRLPVVYNSSGYERVETLRTLEGLVDVYLPDLKYVDPLVSKKYSHAADYFTYAAPAILEMARQAGPPVFDQNGLLRKGMIVRHLILPENTRQSIRVLDWIHDTLPAGTLVSLMCQYTPCGEAGRYPELARRITRREYDKVVGHMLSLGLTDGYLQELSAAKEEYIPDFSLQGVIMR